MSTRKQASAWSAGTSTVSAGEAKRGAEARLSRWAEASVWTDRMVSALVNGVTGGVGRRPTAFFATAGPFALYPAWQAAGHSR